MKKILMNICLAVSVLSFSGCSDFLDRESYGRDTSWKTDEDVMKAVYALYYFVSPNWLSLIQIIRRRRRLSFI